MLGGSLASSILGEPRSTHDIDLAVLLPEQQVEAVAARLESRFFVDVESARDAVRRRGMFNVFHRETMLKVDVFVVTDDAFERERMRRRTFVELSDASPQRVALSTPEDLVVRKLAWFRDGGGVSDRQWRDVLGVLKLQRGRLDLVHMRRWAAHLAVAELLERALVEAGCD